jgi:hypothetical protein
MNFRNSERSLVKVFLKVLLVVSVAQLSQPNCLLKQLGIVVGTSEEITFHVAVELRRLCCSQSSCFFSKQCFIILWNIR